MIGMGQLIILGVFMLLSWIVGAQLKSRFRKYSQIPVNFGLTGKDVAERMLRENGINDVRVIATEGQLSDNYNPVEKISTTTNVVKKAAKSVYFNDVVKLKNSPDSLKNVSAVDKTAQKKNHF